jgi:sulfoxide reductase heme-binding subunit YedZ
MIASQSIWYAERAAGVVAYVLVTGLVVLGVLLSTRVRTSRWPMFAIEDVHRFVGILAGAFVALHVSLLLVDTFVPFSLGQVLVPFTASYRPFATGLGTVAVELLVAVAIANGFRRRLPYKTWRGIHYAGFGVWSAATIHGLLAGSDRHDAWLLSIYIVAVGAVFAATLFRVSTPRPSLESAIGFGLALAIGVVTVLALVPAAAGS